MNTADGHIVEKDADVRQYLPEPFSKRARPLLPSDGMDTGMGGLVGGLEGNDIPTRLKDMDTEGIDVSVLFPTSSFSVSSLIERDYAVAYARAYNDFIADTCRQSPRLWATLSARGLGCSGCPSCRPPRRTGRKKHFGLAAAA